jgi:hypothetical protein
MQKEPENFPRDCASFTRLLDNRRRSVKNDERGREPARETSAGAKTASRSLCLLLERGRRARGRDMLCTGG